MLSLVPHAPVDMEEVFLRFPAVRQSVLSDFDDCALSALFRLRYTNGWSTHPQARGQIFHRVASECLRVMREQDTEGIPVGVALAILEEALYQRDVAPEDIVRVPLRELPMLEMAVRKFAADNTFAVRNIIDVERRLTAEIMYPDEHGQPVRRALTGQLDALIARPPNEAVVIDWKDAQPLDAHVLTPTGWTTMGDLAVGDLVIGSNGRATTVTGVYPKGERLVYEVEFTDGSRTRCCDHHWWTVRRSGRAWQTKRLREIMSDVPSRWHVPAVSPVRFDHGGDRPLDPYLLGALLGDGDFNANGSVGFTSADDEVISAVRTALPPGMGVKHIQRYNWRLAAMSRATPNPLRAALKGLGLMGVKAPAKFIPEAYLLGPVDGRLELLRGLMDTDGFIDVQGRMSYSSASLRLATQVQFLVRSLGGFATLKTWPREGHHDTNVVYFRLPQVPFRLARKRERWHEPRNGMMRSIRSITPLDVQRVQCVEVAAEDMLYVTDDLIVTHNTWALPPEREENAEDPGVSYHGFFQQQFYAWLVMSVYPAVQAVSLREFYVRRTKARPARVTREELPRVERRLAQLVAAFDRAVAAGEPPRLRMTALEQHGHWKPSPGVHCSWCMKAHLCPIDDDFKGSVTNPDSASRVAATRQKAMAVAKQCKARLDPWVEQHGPVDVKWSKGRRVYGPRVIKGGRVRIEEYTPEGADRPGTRVAYNPNLADAMREATARAREERDG